MLKTFEEMLQDLENQKLKISRLPKVELAIRLGCFYANEILVKHILKEAEKDGYNNQNGLAITYDKGEDKYIVVSTNNEYNYLTRTYHNI